MTHRGGCYSVLLKLQSDCWRPHNKATFRNFEAMKRFTLLSVEQHPLIKYPQRFPQRVTILSVVTRTCGPFSGGAVPADSKLMGADVELEVLRNKLNLKLDDVFFLYKCLQACASLDKKSAYPRYSVESKDACWCTQCIANDLSALSKSHAVSTEPQYGYLMSDQDLRDQLAHLQKVPSFRCEGEVLGHEVTFEAEDKIVEFNMFMELEDSFQNQLSEVVAALPQGQEVKVHDTCWDHQDYFLEYLLENDSKVILD